MVLLIASVLHIAVTLIILVVLLLIIIKLLKILLKKTSEIDVTCNSVGSFSTTSASNLQFRFAVLLSELPWAGAFKGTGRVKLVAAGGGKAATWVMDSFAVKHMTSKSDLLVDLVPVRNQVVVAENGKVLQVHGIGSVITEGLVLPNVWYVPEIRMNHVSVHQLTTDHGLEVMMAGTRCSVTKMSDGSEVGWGHLRSDYKYEVDSLIVQQN